MADYEECETASCVFFRHIRYEGLSLEWCISFMQEIGSLHSEVKCECGKWMRTKSRLHRKKLRYIWRCSCGKMKNLTCNTVFSGSKLQLQQILEVLMYYVNDTPMFLIARYLCDISYNSIVTKCQLFRQICSDYIRQNPVKLEGHVHVIQDEMEFIENEENRDEVSHTVEIDESAFGRKRKYNVGKVCKTVWVFGMIQHCTRKFVLEVVQDRTKKTLLPIIQKHIGLDCTIHHDDFATYRSLHRLGYKHDVVNHKLNFVSPTGVCTNTIEGLWSLVKYKIKMMKGLNRTQLSDFLQEFSYRHMYGKNGVIDDTFFKLLKH